MGRGGIKEEESGKKRRTWRWPLATLVVVFLAVAVSSRTNSNVGFFFSDRNSCSCSLQGTGKYKGMVEDCCCDYETVDNLNSEVLNPLLQDLVTTPFFRYFKVKLWCDCPFWPDDGMCRLRDCSVCECPENEFPEPFKKPFVPGLPSDDLKCQEGKPQGAVDRTIDNRAFRGWVETKNPWTHDDDTDSGEMTYVNLQLNPERYTGYTGPSARRIWDSIYSENCPKYSSGETCPEKKVLYKLISGLHSSISMHIAADYLLDESSNQWGQNIELMYDRILRHPDRVRNMYFTYLFVLRAVTKATAYLEQAEYDTGNHAEDLKTQSLIKQLLYSPKLQTACPVPFDEAKLWQGQSGPELKQQIQKQFRNISALMDCVGCEKCRLWGKLQVQGLGTALKILFSVGNQDIGDQTLQLQRNEVIALVNLLNRLSESVKMVHDMGPDVERLMEDQIAKVSAKPGRLRRIWDLAVSFWVKTAKRCRFVLLKVKYVTDSEHIIGEVIVYLQKHLLCRNYRILLPSVVFALSLMVLRNGLETTGTESEGGYKVIKSLCSRISSPPEAIPVWRWSYHQDLPSERATDPKKIDELYACQELLLIFSDMLGETAWESQQVLLLGESFDMSTVFEWERGLFI